MRKKEYASGICFVSIATIGLMAAGLATPEWTVAKMGRNGSDTCVVTRKIGLFSFDDTSAGCTSSRYTFTCSVYDTRFLEFSHGIQYAVIAFCALAILFSLITMAVSAFNICTNPYETYLSSLGLMAYNIIGLIMALIAVILYTVLLYTELEEPIKKSVPDKLTCGPTDQQTSSLVFTDEGYYLQENAYFGFSFFLVVVSIVVYGVGILLAVLSERDTVQKIRNIISPPKEETDDQKMKDIMIY